MTEPASHQIESARVRRSPRYGVFLALGAAVGILAALILTFAFDGTVDRSASTGVVYSSTQVLGFLSLFCIPIGMALSATAALISDRMLARRTREVRVMHDTIHLDSSTDAEIEQR
ncbi:potassium transporter Trk [Microbacterium sp.]|uniref:potassium transporter Trk n=1 Tax=Microbacterium sp. TaxID=51671 RepID=UPI0025CD8441|nr:potassium transporter Trk [Microbacterium sp.]